MYYLINNINIYNINILLFTAMLEESKDIFNNNIPTNSYDNFNHNKEDNNPYNKIKINRKLKSK